MPDRLTATFFTFFNEIGIIEQLSRALFEARLPPGFLVSHFTVLNHLVRVQDGRTPLELARAFQVPKTTMTHTLAKLDLCGLIRMEPNPKDARSKRVWLTEAGRAFREEAISHLGPDLAAMSETVDEKSVAEILPVLEAVRRYLDAERDRPAAASRRLPGGC